MKKLSIILVLFFSTGSAAFSQSETEKSREVNKLYKSVIKRHLQDRFYLVMRPFYSVRTSTEDYIIKYNGKKWSIYIKKTRKIFNKKLRLRNATATGIAKKLEFNRILLPLAPDSVSQGADKPLIGDPTYVIIASSKGHLKRIEYPILIHYDLKRDWRDQSIYWKSDYLETIVEELKKAFEKEETI